MSVLVFHFIFPFVYFIQIEFMTAGSWLAIFDQHLFGRIEIKKRISKNSFIDNSNDFGTKKKKTRLSDRFWSKEKESWRRLLIVFFYLIPCLFLLCMLFSFIFCCNRHQTPNLSDNHLLCSYTILVCLFFLCTLLSD